MKKQIGLIVLLATTYMCFAGDTLHVNTLNSFHLMQSENLWLMTENSAGLVFNNPETKVAFETGIDQKKGDFHLIRVGDSYNSYSFSTQSYQSIKNKIFLYGTFAYHFIDDKGGQWNGTYDPYRGNPYILADSVSGINYRRENYNLAGGLGYKLNDRLLFGCGVDYFVGVGAKQKDPRPNNTYVQFRINPSIIFQKKGYKLGLDIGYLNRKEEIEYDVMRNNFSPTFFMFKGFGFFTKEVDSNSYRFAFANEIFGGLQFEKKLRKLNTLSELKASYNVEEIEDGSSVIRKLDGGEWKTFRVELIEQVNLKKGLSNHLFKGQMSYFSGDGNEFTQEVVYEGTWNVQKYITVAKNLKFNRQTINGILSYNYQSFDDLDRLSWDVVTTANFINNREKFYYIPEIFTADYSNISGKMYVQKNFYLNKFHFAPALNASYTSNLSNNLLLSILPEITKKQRKDVFQQEFDYYASDLLIMGGELKCGINPGQSKNRGQAYVSFCYDYCKQLISNQSYNAFSARIGFVF